MSAPERIWVNMNESGQWALKLGVASNFDHGRYPAYLRADGLPREMAEALRLAESILVVMQQQGLGGPQAKQLLNDAAALLAKWDTLMEKEDG